MFIWTIGDAIGFAVCAMAIFGFGVIWLLIKADDRRLKKKRKAKETPIS